MIFTKDHTNFVHLYIEQILKTCFNFAGFSVHFRIQVLLFHVVIFLPYWLKHIFISYLLLLICL